MKKANTTDNTSIEDLLLYTKRTCTDNSELFITSKLDKLYKRTHITYNSYTKKRALKKYVEQKTISNLKNLQSGL